MTRNDFGASDGAPTLHEIVARIARELDEERAARRHGVVKQSSSRKKAPVPKRPSAKTINEQLADVTNLLGIRKKDIADYIRVDPSYVSQLLARGMNESHLRKIAAACGVKPQYFDEFVAISARDILMNDRDLLEIVRAYAFEADEDVREQFLKRSRHTLSGKIATEHLMQAAKRPRPL